MTHAQNYGRVLFLDLARQAGWAEGIPGQGVISGTIQLAAAGAGHGAVGAGLIGFLEDRFSTGRYQEVCFERPLDIRHLKRMTNFATARQLYGLCMMAEAVCYRHRIPRVTEASAQDIRKHLLGKQPAKGKAKIEVSNMLRVLGYRPVDDNEADAIAGWLYVSAIRAPGCDIASPLFSGGAS